MKTKKDCLKELIEKVSKEELLKRFGGKKAKQFSDKDKKKETPEKSGNEKEAPKESEEKEDK